MDVSELNTLLHQSESETLDFKREQYPFEGSDNAVKSELLKDVLAMANAWKSCDAHILVGVEERTGKKAETLGVREHLDDAKLQQFVNEKTNKPVSFGYSVVTVDGKQVGVITVAAEQGRPLFLKRDFGKLKKNVVYIRRGSSTGEAGPDEIAEMGAERASAAEVPSIEIEFADTRTRTRLGREMRCTSVLLVDRPPPPPEEALDVVKLIAKMPKIESALGKFRIDPAILDPMRSFRPSPEEVREYRQLLALHAEVGFWVRNHGNVTAADVTAVIRGNQVDGLSHLDETSHPKNRTSVGLGGSMPSVFDSDVTVAEHGDHWTVTLEVGKLQPKSECWLAGRWYVGCRHATKLQLEAEIFADNLPEPIRVPLTVRIDTEEKVYEPRDFEESDDE